MAFLNKMVQHMANAALLAAVLTGQPQCEAALVETYTDVDALAHQIHVSSPSEAKVRRESKPGICDLDLYYGTGFLDICHYGRAQEARPAVILVHGAKSSKASFYEEWGQRLYASGYAVVSVEYRVSRCPEDISSATDWLRKNAYNFGVDPARIALFGVSWGGTCASIVGLTIEIPGLRAIALASASIAVPAVNVLPGLPISILLMQSKYDRLVNLNRSQEMYKSLRNMGMDVHKIRYNAQTSRLLNMGEDPLVKLLEFLGRVLQFQP